ncbi:MAG: hypothetical protein AABZ05_08005, partial [Nitrospirota bacterium]
SHGFHDLSRSRIPAKSPASLIAKAIDAVTSESKITCSKPLQPATASTSRGKTACAIVSPPTTAPRCGCGCRGGGGEVAGYF